MRGRGANILTLKEGELRSLTSSSGSGGKCPPNRRKNRSLRERSTGIEGIEGEGRREANPPASSRNITM